MVEVVEVVEVEELVEEVEVAEVVGSTWSGSRCSGRRRAAALGSGASPAPWGLSIDCTFVLPHFCKVSILNVIN